MECAAGVHCPPTPDPHPATTATLVVDAHRQVAQADPARDSPHGNTAHVRVEACVKTTQPLDCTFGQFLRLAVIREQPQASPSREPSAPAAPRNPIVGMEYMAS